MRPRPRAPLRVRLSLLSDPQLDGECGMAGRRFLLCDLLLISAAPTPAFATRGIRGKRLWSFYPQFLPPRQTSPFLPWEADSTQAGESDPTAALPHHGQGCDSGPVICLVQCPAQNPGQGRPVQSGEPWGHCADAPEFVGREMGLGSKRETESAFC